MTQYAIGMHFGIESVCVLVVDIRTGRIAGRAHETSSHRPQDWLNLLSISCRSALKESQESAEQVVGIGVAFNGSHMLPCLIDGTPLDRPMAFEQAPLWIVAGDWMVWQLCSGVFPNSQTTELVRSTCQAGFGVTRSKRGDPFSSPRFADTSGMKVTGRLAAPGTRAGGLSSSAAKRLGLPEGIAVSAAVIDTHACVPGVGVAAPSTMVLVMGATGLQLMNSRINATPPGIAGVVEEGILPGYVGYETRRSNLGDALAWVAKSLGQSQEQLSNDAASQPPGSGGVMTQTWLSDCHTSLIDKQLSEAFVGLSVSTTPAQIYRAAIEASAYNVRSIRDNFQAAGVPVRRFVATGELPAKSPLLMQIYADVLGEKIALSGSDQPAALGAAILGCLAAGPEVTGYPAISTAIAAIAHRREDLLYRPDLPAKKAYTKLYPINRALAEQSVK